MTLVLVGHLGRSHGLDGEIYLDSCPLTALELHEVKRFTWRGARDERPLEIVAVRPANQRLLVRFSGVDSRQDAAELTNGDLFADAARLPDPGPGMAYHFQLVGLEVREADGRVLGTLQDIIVTGAHSVYVVRGERELLVPASPGVVQHVDLDARTMTVQLPAGLEEAME